MKAWKIILALAGVGTAIAIPIFASGNKTGTIDNGDGSSETFDMDLKSFYPAGGKPYYNNPGNIKKSPDTFNGEIVSENPTFKSFDSIIKGYRAMIKIFRTYANKYKVKTLKECIQKWAGTDNEDFPAYLAFVKNGMNVNQDKSLPEILATPALLRQMLFYMSKFEQSQGFKPPLDKIDKAIQMVALENA